MNKKRKTVNIRMWSETRDRLKIASIRKGVTLMQHLEDVSKKGTTLDK